MVFLIGFPFWYSFLSLSIYMSLNLNGVLGSEPQGNLHVLADGRFSLFLTHFWGPGHVLMHPEAYLERLASTRRSRILKISSDAMSIDFSNIRKCKCSVWLLLFESPWFRGYEKDAERYLESICLRFLAWTLFWTCSVKEAMFCQYWKISARRRAWK